MTTLAITPNWKNKTAKFKGTVAAGEHVSVTIQNDNGEGGEFVEDVSTLRLRVVDPCNGRTLAIFPEPVPEGETSETWDADLSPLRCTLNLNTVQMLKAVPPAANVPLLWVLDDYDNKTLYFKEQFEVTHWPRLRGEEEPTDLDDYKDIIADFNTRLTAAEQTVATAATNAQSAAASASAAAAFASAAATAATDAQTGAMASKNAAQAAANDAASAKTAAEDAQDAAEEAQEAAETAQGKAQEYAEAAAESAAAFVVDDTLSIEGAAADAKAVGEANQDLITQINTVQGHLDTEVTARETLAAAVGDNRQNLANEIARAQGAEQGLENRKADKATTYTKTEVDTKIAGVQTFQKYLVNELPDPEVADYKGLYLVPTGETTPEGDLCYEYTVVGEVGSRRWEKIGGTTVDTTLDNSVTPTSANGVKSSGIWSAIWGALAALPAGFSSLYDWVVDQLAGKASKSDVDPLLFAQYYPEGNVKSAAEFTAGIKYDAPDTVNRTITVKPFCNTGTSGDDNSGLIGRVVIPPFADGDGNGYISDDGTRYKVVGVSDGNPDSNNANLTAIVTPNTVTTIGGQAFYYCNSLVSVSLPSASTIGEGVFDSCDALTSISLPSATTIEFSAFGTCASLVSISLPSASTIGGEVFFYCTALTSVDFGDTPRSDVPSLGTDAFNDVPTTCKIIVPDSQYDAWTAASGWSDLVTAGYKFLRHSEWKYARKYELAGKADVSAIPYDLGTPIVIDTASSEVVEGETVYYGAATLADRTANIVQVTAATPLDELRITFPAATSGKVRDFGLRVEIGTGSAALAAPALVPIAPPGETIKIENNAAEIPALADGTATAKGVTLLYFSETAPGVFVVKGEQVEEVA